MMPRGVQIRPFRAYDFDAVVRLAHSTLGHDAPSSAHLAHDFLLDSGFIGDDLLIADQDGHTVGFLLAPRLRPPARVDHPSHHRTLWIAAFGVDPDRRAQGIGTALVRRAMGAALRDGLQRIDVADIPVRYLVPGIDPAACPAAHGLLVARLGFRERDRVASMRIDCAAIDGPPADRKIRRLEAAEIPLVRDFLCRAFGWSWWWHMARPLWAQLAGAQIPSETLVAWGGGQPIGVVHYHAHRFGPLAVAEPARGLGLGSRLTLAALARMRDRGLRYAYFLIADARAERFYGHLGFTVQRRFVRLTRALTPP